MLYIALPELYIMETELFGVLPGFVYHGGGEVDTDYLTGVAGFSAGNSACNGGRAAFSSGDIWACSAQVA